MMRWLCQSGFTVAALWLVTSIPPAEAASPCSPANASEAEECGIITNTTVVDGLYYRVMETGWCGGPSLYQPLTADWLDVPSKAQCEDVAQSFSTMFHGVTAVTDVSSYEFPIGCYYRIGVGVYFNSLGTAQNSTERVSICYFDINEPAPAPNDEAEGYAVLDFSTDIIRCDAPGYQWVFSKQECNEAAVSLSLGDTNATEVFEGDYENGLIQRAPVYGCYLDRFSSATGQLFYYKPTKKFDPNDFLDYSNSAEGRPARFIFVFQRADSGRL
eukprot:INCI17180.4.p1 GENE.INCI17180.4~~INCI17180.4.p1  ORF type:complete len:272 (+),score=43.55 INCI17180.4:89-904(+)